MKSQKVLRPFCPSDWKENELPGYRMNVVLGHHQDSDLPKLCDTRKEV